MSLPCSTAYTSPATPRTFFAWAPRSAAYIRPASRAIASTLLMSPWASLTSRVCAQAEERSQPNPSAKVPVCLARLSNAAHCSRAASRLAKGVSPSATPGRAAQKSPKAYAAATSSLASSVVCSLGAVSRTASAKELRGSSAPRPATAFQRSPARTGSSAAAAATAWCRCCASRKVLMVVSLVSPAHIP
jgi:hypothetical protein